MWVGVPDERGTHVEREGERGRGKSRGREREREVVPLSALQARGQAVVPEERAPLWRERGCQSAAETHVKGGERLEVKKGTVTAKRYICIYICMYIYIYVYTYIFMYILHISISIYLYNLYIDIHSRAGVLEGPVPHSSKVAHHVKSRSCGTRVRRRGREWRYSEARSRFLTCEGGLVSHKVFLKSLCKSQFQHTSINSFFILAIVQDT